MVAALKEMSLRPPSSQARAGRILGFTQQHINKAILAGRMGHDLRDAVIAFLYEHEVIREPTVAGLLQRYGREAQREQWDWPKLLATPDPFVERAIAKKQARKDGVPVEVVARLCTRPPWIFRSFAHETTSWWVEHMKREWQADLTRQAVSAQQVAEMVREEDELRLKAG